MFVAKYSATIVLALCIAAYAAPLPRPDVNAINVAPSKHESFVNTRAFDSSNEAYIRSLQQLIADHQNRWQDYMNRMNRVIRDSDGELTARQQAVVNKLSAQAAKTQEAIDRMTRQVEDLSAIEELASKFSHVLR